MLRIDISECAEKLPKLAYGRILSLPRLDEWYATVSLFGFRVFVANGLYRNMDFSNNTRIWRCWFARPNPRIGDMA